MSGRVDEGSPATKSRSTVVEALRLRKRSEDTGRENGDGNSKSEGKAIQETKTTIGTMSNSPGGLGLKSHNRVVEALKERKLSARESGEGGGGGEIKREQSLPGDQVNDGGIKTKQSNEGEITKCLTADQSNGGGIKTRQSNNGEITSIDQGNDGGIKKTKGLTVAQGLLFPPSDTSLQEMDSNPAKVSHADNFAKFIVFSYQLQDYCCDPVD